VGTTFLIGERLNSTRPAVRRIFEERDERSLIDSARKQIEGGASCIDLNASMLMAGEEEALGWGALAVREKLGVPVMLDSPNAAILGSLAIRFGAGAVLNSITCDEDALEATLPAIARSGSGIVAMLKDKKGIPATVDGKLTLAERVVNAASKHGISCERIYLDPVFSPLATSTGGLNVVLDTVQSLKHRYPDCSRIGGLSNISFGMPERKVLNRVFAVMALRAGMIALICDTTDLELMRSIKAAEAIVGLDANSKGFLEFYRAHKPA